MSIIITVGTSLLSGVLLLVVTYLLKKVKNLQSDKKSIDDAMRLGMISLLRIEIIEYHQIYTTRGSIPSYALSNFEDMCTAYFALGGNGLVPELRREIKCLPIKKNKED